MSGIGLVVYMYVWNRSRGLHQVLRFTCMFGIGLVANMCVEIGLVVYMHVP